MRPPVVRGLLFRSDLVEVRDNRCGRREPSITPATEPLPFHEIVLPRHGLWLRHLGRRALPVDCNHVHFVNRGESHRVSHPAGCGDRNTGLVLAEPVWAEMLTGPAPRRPAVPFVATHVLVNGPIAIAHRCLLAACWRGAEPLAVEELAFALAAKALAAADGVLPPAVTPRSQRDLAAAALPQLHARLDQPLTLTALARALGVSPFHLSRSFTRCMGLSLHRYRERLRLQAALAEVLTTRRPLADIAAATGFADRSHLSRRLRAFAGVPPQALRGARTRPV